MLFRSDGPDSFEALAGKEVGVAGGTTTEAALRQTLSNLAVEATVVEVESHADGLAKLEAGEVEAYFADRALLAHLLTQSAAPEKLKLSSRYFSYEPYALAFARGDDDFRLLVDRALSEVYRSGDIEAILASVRLDPAR